MELFVQHYVALAVQNRRLLNGNVSDDLHACMMITLLDGAKEM